MTNEMCLQILMIATGLQNACALILGLQLGQGMQMILMEHRVHLEDHNQDNQGRMCQ